MLILVFTYFEFDPDQSLFSNICSTFFGGIDILVSDVLETRYRYSMTENTSDTASIVLTEFT